VMSAKHPKMASDQAQNGLKWGDLALESARIIEKQALASAGSYARWVFQQPDRPDAGLMIHQMREDA
jgi:hypothetical protein